MSDPWVTFVRARLDKDAEVAREAGRMRGGDVWEAHDNDDWPMTVTGRSYPDGGIVDVVDPDDNETCHHIARHDPARVLAEVDAKRRTLIRCEEEMLSGIPRLVHFAQQTVREMALPYADHPDRPTKQ